MAKFLKTVYRLPGSAWQVIFILQQNWLEEQVKKEYMDDGQEISKRNC